MKSVIFSDERNATAINLRQYSSQKHERLWDFSIAVNKRLEHNKPTEGLIIDPPCHYQTRTDQKEEKVINYDPLKFELARL